MYCVVDKGDRAEREQAAVGVGALRGALKGGVLHFLETIVKSERERETLQDIRI